MNLYPNLYALLESDSHARQLFERAPAQIRRQLLVRRQTSVPSPRWTPPSKPCKAEIPKNNALPNCQAGECVVFRFFKKTNQERRMNYFAITFREDAIASATGRKAASEAGVKRNI